MSRYQILNQVVAQIKPETILEVGTWNGERAIQMCTEALKHQDKVTYYGYDLFEAATSATDKEEFNVKKHVSFDEVTKKLGEFKKEHNGFDFTLVKGNTRNTLTHRVNGFYSNAPEVDLAFIDGGHSLKTFKNDFDALKKGSRCIVLDDYYVQDSSGKCPDIEKYGCNKIVEADVSAFMPTNVFDPVTDGGGVQMVIYGERPKIKIQKQLIIKTKNSVKDEVIQEHIKYAKSKDIAMIEECRIHDKIVIFVSGGPSYKDHLNEIAAAQQRGDYVVCVKTSHDTLIKKGIIPWACVLLDPREHVLDFIENPHPDVLYITASQVHPKTLDRLIDANANIRLYHAAVGAGEEKVCEGDMMVLGGSTSATRGISVLHAMGFRSMEMYGYDSCYYGEVPKTKYTNGKPIKALDVTVLGKRFMSDSELVAQAQDFEKLAGTDINLTVHGEGMIPHIYHKSFKKRSDFKILYG